MTDGDGFSVLIIEDDPAMRRGLRDNYARHGYAVHEAADGEAGYEAALATSPDLIVLDIMLPRIHGFEVCRLLRAEGLACPIIMLTAKGEEADIVLGLNLGADDYLTKPFGIRELLARSRALLRRSREQATPCLQFGPFTLDLAARRLTCNGEPIQLTPKELGVLALLAARPGRVLTRDQIIAQVWGRAIIVTARSVDRCVATLRAKLLAGDDHDWIRTVHAIGYSFEAAPSGPARSP